MGRTLRAIIIAGLVACGSPQIQAPAPTLAAPVWATASPSTTLITPVETTPEPTPPPSPSPAEVAEPVGIAVAAGSRIQIPRLGINLPILEGNVERDIIAGRTPNGSAFHLPGTAAPGERGNSYLYAHARVGMFLNLWNARIGDQVTLTTQNGVRIEYQVTEVHPRVPWQDTSWIQNTPDTRLTLQTSTGPNPTDPRFVVIAVQKN